MINHLYWLDPLFTTDFISRQRHDSMKGDGEALLEKLIASIKTTKARSKNSSE